MAISTEDQTRIKILKQQGDDCLQNARAAIDGGGAIAAREWFDAADSAFRAAREIERPPL